MKKITYLSMRSLLSLVIYIIVSIFIVSILKYSTNYLYSANDNQKSKEKKINTLVPKDNSNIDNLDKESKGLLNNFIKISKIIEQINTKNLDKDIILKLKRKISNLLRKTSRFSTYEEQKKYLYSLSNDILKSDFISSNLKWMKMEKNKVDIIIEPEKKSKKIKIFILLNDLEKTEQVRKYTQNIDKFLGNLESNKSQISINSSLIPLISVSNIIFPINLKRYILIKPDYEEYKKKIGYKLIILENVMKFHFKHSLKPVAQKILTKKNIDLVDFESFFSHVVLHRISHFLGPVIVDSTLNKLTLVNESLGNYFHTIEEIKADTLGLHNISVLTKQNFIEEKKANNFYMTYIINLLEKLRHEPKKEINQAYLIQFNYLLKKGGIVFNINNRKLLIDLKKVKNTTKELMLNVIEIENRGSISNAEKLVNNYSSISNELKEIIKILKKIPEEFHFTSFQKGEE